MNTETQFPEIKKVNHLLVIVGRNPMPDALAAPLRVADYGKISIMCRSEDQTVARKLSYMYKKSGIESAVLECVDESDQFSITGATKNAFIREQVETIRGIFYTEGAPVSLVTHAYKAMCEIKYRGQLSDFQREGANQLSYLSSDKMSMVIERGNFKPTIVELAGLVQLKNSLKSILQWEFGENLIGFTDCGNCGEVEKSIIEANEKYGLDIDEVYGQVLVKQYGEKELVFEAVARRGLQILSIDRVENNDVAKWGVVKGYAYVKKIGGNAARLAVIVFWCKEKNLILRRLSDIGIEATIFVDVDDIEQKIATWVYNRKVARPVNDVPRNSMH